MPRAANFPVDLPTGLLNELASRRRLLLMLDYDGTLAPIVSDPAAAWPLNQAREAIIAMASHRDRIEIAVISGRELSELERLLGIARGIYLVGVHGLEMADPESRREIVPNLKPALRQLDEVRRWLRERIPVGTGLTVEDKRLAVALHYRNADPIAARPVLEDFERFVAGNAPQLKIKHGKMVAEATPHGADKGAAVLRLFERIGTDTAPVYFGDDLTDEDAFRALAGRGVTVTVGGEGGSVAQYRVEGPAQVASILSSLAATLDAF